MDIRKAKPCDIDGIKKLLFQVNNVHAEYRPDLFFVNGIKYRDEELERILEDPVRPVYVASDETGAVLGYVFCVFEATEETTSLRRIKTLYIDDLCVDAAYRGLHIGTDLYRFAVNLARESGCSRVTLHAWNFNRAAFTFYEKLGMKPLVTTMEQRLDTEDSGREGREEKPE